MHMHDPSCACFLLCKDLPSERSCLHFSECPLRVMANAHYPGALSAVLLNQSLERVARLTHALPARTRWTGTHRFRLLRTERQVTLHFV